MSNNKDFKVKNGLSVGGATERMSVSSSNGNVLFKNNGSVGFTDGHVYLSETSATNSYDKFSLIRSNVTGSARPANLFEMDNGASGGTANQMNFKQQAFTPAVGDLILRQAFLSENSTGQLEQRAGLDVEMLNVTNGQEDCQFTFSTGPNNGVVDRLKINNSGVDVTGTLAADGLDIQGNADITGQLGWYSNASSAWQDGTLRANNFIFKNAGGTEKMRLTSTGLGIGTSSPGGKLHISGTGSAPAKLIWERSDGGVGSKNWAAYIDNTHDLLFGKTNDSGTLTHDYLHIQDNGNVGIGMSSPSYKLHVRSGDANDDVAYIHHDNAAQSSGSVLKVRSDAGASNGYSLLDVQNNSGTALYVSGDNKVGLGTSSPAYGLDVRNTIYSSVAAATVNLTLGDSTNGTTSGISTNNSNLIFLANGSAESMRIDSSGNVLVGKTAASSATVGFQAGQDGFTAITRASAQPLVLNRTTTDGIIADFRKDGATVGNIGTYSQNANSDFFIGFNNSSSDVGLGFGHSAGTGRAYFPCRENGSGVSSVIDIGTSDFKYKDLYLSGTANVGGISLTPSTGTVASINIPTTGDSLKLTYRTADRVKIDQYGLHLYLAEMSTSSSIGYGSVLLSSNDNTGMGKVCADTQGAGLEYSAYNSKLWCWNGTFAGALEYGTLSAYSDERLKSDIQPITSALDTVTQIQGITYTKDGNPTAGVTAQQLETVLPNLVKTNDPDGDCHKCPKDADGNEIHDYKTVEYVPLIAYLIEAVKELSTQNAALEARITTLEV